jgi:hypothetical protein
MPGGNPPSPTSTRMEHWEGQAVPRARVGLERPWTWLAVATPLSFVLMTCASFLYAALELPWSAYDSWWGLILIAAVPLLSGAAVGLAFDRMRPALVAAWSVGLASAASSGILLALPYLLGLVHNTGRFSGQAWTTGFLAFLAIMPFVAIGSALAVASNTVE